MHAHVADRRLPLLRPQHAAQCMQQPRYRTAHHVYAWSLPPHTQKVKVADAARAELGTEEAASVSSTSSSRSGTEDKAGYDQPSSDWLSPPPPWPLIQPPNA